jgi:uncharacterized protein
MKIEGPAKMLRIYVGEDDHFEGKPLYTAIVMALREAGIAGATVVRGIEGFGKASCIHTTNILRLSQDLPVIIEAVDTADKIDGVLTTVTNMVGDGLVTTESIEVVKY